MIIENAYFYVLHAMEKKKYNQFIRIFPSAVRRKPA